MKKAYIGILKYIPIALIACIALYLGLPHLISPVGSWYHKYSHQNRLAVKKNKPHFTYYLSPFGNDDHNGKSAATPWKTLQKINETKFNPGDSILLQANQVFRGNISFDKEDVGTPENPITLSSYGSGKATLEAGTETGISLYNSQGYHITNLNIKGDGAEINNGSGIAAVNDLYGDIKLNYIRIDSVEVAGFGFWGILIDSNQGKSGYRNVAIAYANVHDNGDAGVYVYGHYNNLSESYAHENVKISHVKAYRNLGRPQSPTNTGSGIVVSDTDNGIIEHCVAYENGALCHSKIGGPVGIWAWDSRNITIQYNEAYKNKTGANKDGGGFDLDGGTTNSVMQYNYSHDNEGAGFFLAQFNFAREHSNNIIRYNISQNDGRKNDYAALEVWGEAKNAYVYNNTVIITATPASKTSALVIRPNEDNGNLQKAFPAGLTFANNIFLSSGQVTLVNLPENIPQLKFINNNYYSLTGQVEFHWNGRQYKSLASWREATSQEKDGQTTYGFTLDPQLVYQENNGLTPAQISSQSFTRFELKASSPMINAGIDIGAAYKIQNRVAVDINGVKIPQEKRYDLGACEFLSQSGLKEKKTL